MHLRKVDTSRDAKKKYIESEKKNAEISVITFDLQRQLWTYNFGIHDCQNNKAFMHIWSEIVASRGASEVSSSVLKFAK